jgi:predicted O-methyltransferase YrrM
LTIADHLRRSARLVSSIVEHGPFATRIAVEAKRRGAKQKLLEFAGLVALVRKHPPATVVEIGTLHGGTLWAWTRIAPDDAAIISIDLPGGPFGGGYTEDDGVRLRGYARSKQTVHLIRADSHDSETRQRLVEVLGNRKIDVLFIDGDHTFDGVRRDFETFSPLVQGGGLIAFHDIVPHDDPTCGVDRLWRDLVGIHSHREFIDRSPVRAEARRWGGIGVLVLAVDR